MLNKTDRLRARFCENDPVCFGQRKPRVGTITRLNRTTATVQCNNSGDAYLVPFKLLKHLTPEPPNSIETKLESTAILAHELLTKYGLKTWKFKFDHSTRRAGCCNYHDKMISISFDLVRNASDKDTRDTILHEIAHALVGKKHNHDAVWKEKARKIGGTGERMHRLTFSPPRYHVTCENHCWTHTAERRNPRLVCRQCGGTLVYSPNISR